MKHFPYDYLHSHDNDTRLSVNGACIKQRLVALQQPSKPCHSAKPERATRQQIGPPYFVGCLFPNLNISDLLRTRRFKTSSFSVLIQKTESNRRSVWVPVCFAAVTKSPSPIFDATCMRTKHIKCQKHLTHTGASSHTWLGSTARAWFTERSPSRRFLALCSNDGCSGVDVS